MATHSNILAWRMPCTEAPGSLQSTGVAKSQTQLSIHVTCTSWIAQDEGQCPKGPFLAHNKCLFLLFFHSCCICLRAPQFSVWAGQSEVSILQTIKHSVPSWKTSHTKALLEQPSYARLVKAERLQTLGTTFCFPQVQTKWKPLSSGILKWPGTLEGCLGELFSYSEGSQRNDPQNYHPWSKLTLIE